MNAVRFGSSIVSQVAKPVSQSIGAEAKVAKKVVETVVTGAPNEVATAVQKGKISSFFSKMMGKIKESSHSISTVSETMGAIKENYKNARGEEVGVIGSIVQGIKRSKGTIKESVKELSGINDIKMAKKEKGVGGALAESGKAALKVVLSGALTVAGTVTPVPGAGLAGLFAGEKIAEKIAGKPISRQIKKMV